MNYLNVDIVLFSVFLVANLILGLLAGRHVKTLRAYAIGNKDFSTATITSTIVATWIGGGFMFYSLSNTYTTGLHFAIAVAGASLGLLLTGQLLAVRMGEFLNNLSVAEAMGDLFSPIVRIITAIGGILGGIGYIAIQFQVIAKILALLFGIEGVQVTITAAAIVIFYSAFGGIRSVTLTDILQFFTFSIIIPILALIVWNSLKDPGQVVHILTNNPNFDLRKVIGWNSQFMSTLGLMLYFAIPGMNPTAFQRVVMARNPQQAKQSFTYAAGLSLLVYMSAVWVAILLLADNPDLDPNKLTNYIIDHYAYKGLKGLIAVGITAMAMSTADSYLNATTVLAVNDIIKPLKPSFQESTIIIRLFSCLLGSFALLLALRTTDILELMLLTGSFYMPIITVPLLLAIFGFRSSTRAVLIGMTAGFITVLVWGKYLAYTGINNIIPGMVANIIGLIGSHYILGEKGGWVGIKEKGPLLAARQARIDVWQGFINSFKRPQLYAYLQKNLPAKESLYSLFGLYVIGATYALFFTVPETIVTHYQKLYDIIAHSVLIVTFVFLTYPAWPPTFRAKWFITFAWPAGIFYALFVVGSILVVMSGFHQVQVMIFMLNLVIAALLLSWPLVLVLSLSGIIVTYAIFHLVVGTAPLAEITSLDSALKFSIIYGVLLFSSFFIALVRFKQSKTKLEDKNSYLMTIQAAIKDQLAQVSGYREELLKELDQEEISLFDHTTAAYIQQAIYRITDYLRLEVSKVNLNELIDQLKATLKLQDLDPAPKLILKQPTQIKTIQADLPKLQQLLVDSIVYIQSHNTTHQPILVDLEDATLGHTIDHMKDYTRKLSALKITITTENKLPITKPLYMVSPTQAASLNPQTTSEPALLENLRIVEAHYGYADIQSPHTHVYVIPINVREVRGKVMELLREPAAVDPQELKHPLAIELEQKLFDSLKGTNVDLKVIHKALNTIKKYHAGVKRKSGEPFFTHPIAVALILLTYCQDQDAVVASLLHDTIEDTSLSMAHIRAMFGEKVAFIVGKVTNLEDKLRRISLEDHENLHRLMNYEDERAAFVKLADRLHNMRTIQGHSDLDKQKRIANETLSFFVGLAEKLGLMAMAEELKTCSLEVLSKK